MTAQLPCSFDIDESEKKLKICIVYSRNPFPMMRGDQLTVSHLISFLSARGHSLDLLTLDIGGDIQPDQRKWLDENCNNAYRIKHNYLDMFYGLVRGLIKALPMQVAIFNNSKQERLLKSLDLKNNYDVVYTYYLRSAEISKMFKGKNVLAMQLSQTLNTRRIRDNTDSRIKKIIYSLEAFLIERYEGVIWKSFRNVALIGEKDLESMEAVSEKYSGEKISNWFYSAHGHPNIRVLEFVGSDFLVQCFL